ncbi:unnamed protein product [Prorocentrum cordatum]|uniref:Uncharacterized protein n=1 Tax=Prorocentrum cordatum TaxID=2364126 RepID=A0ABN9TVQ4_9DINO|nr:unnamed protein product [Polarella glacialis]
MPPARARQEKLAKMRLDALGGGGPAARRPGAAAAPGQAEADGDSRRPSGGSASARGPSRSVGERGQLLPLSARGAAGDGGSTAPAGGLPPSWAMFDRMAATMQDRDSENARLQRKEQQERASAATWSGRSRTPRSSGSASGSSTPSTTRIDLVASYQQWKQAEEARESQVRQRAVRGLHGLQESAKQNQEHRFNAVKKEKAEALAIAERTRLEVEEEKARAATAQAAKREEYKSVLQANQRAQGNDKKAKDDFVEREMAKQAVYQRQREARDKQVEEAKLAKAGVRPGRPSHESTRLSMRPPISDCVNAMLDRLRWNVTTNIWLRIWFGCRQCFINVSGLLLWLTVAGFQHDQWQKLKQQEAGWRKFAAFDAENSPADACISLDVNAQQEIHAARVEVEQECCKLNIPPLTFSSLCERRDAFLLYLPRLPWLGPWRSTGASASPPVRGRGPVCEFELGSLFASLKSGILESVAAAPKSLAAKLFDAAQWALRKLALDARPSAMGRESERMAEDLARMQAVLRRCEQAAPVADYGDVAGFTRGPNRAVFAATTKVAVSAGSAQVAARQWLEGPGFERDQWRTRQRKMRCLGQFLQRGAVAAPREIQAACVELEQECYKLKFEDALGDGDLSDPLSVNDPLATAPPPGADGRPAPPDRGRGPVCKLELDNLLADLRADILDSVAAASKSMAAKLFDNAQWALRKLAVLQEAKHEAADL